MTSLDQKYDERMYLKKFIPVVLIALVACGKDKGGGGGGGAPAGGPACAEAAAAYVKHDSASGGNRIYSLKPTPEEAKQLAAKLEADCTTRNWSEKTKTCLVAPGQRKLGDNCDTDKQVLQIVFEGTNEIKAAREAAGAGSAAAGSGSAAAGSADGSAAAGSGSADGSAAGSAK